MKKEQYHALLTCLTASDQILHVLRMLSTGEETRHTIPDQSKYRRKGMGRQRESSSIEMCLSQIDQQLMIQFLSMGRTGYSKKPCAALCAPHLFSLLAAHVRIALTQPFSFYVRSSVLRSPLLPYCPTMPASPLSFCAAPCVCL